MQVSAANSSMPSPPAGGSEALAKMRQSFQKLGSALDSGNLGDAKDALAQLQKNAAAQGPQGNNPLSSKIDALSKAVNSGDLKAAQDAYADIQKSMSQRPTRSGGPHPGGAPSGASGNSSGASASSNSSKVYDKKDANKDGKVSYQEGLDYDRRHPDEIAKTSGSVQSDSERGQYINVSA